MEKTKHTPGPWTAHDDDGTGTLPCVLSDKVNVGGNFYVAQCNSFDDACLIAAAPDLLKACRELWFAIQVIPVDWNNPEAKELSEKAIDAMDEAEIAMNRAEGRE